MRVILDANVLISYLLAPASARTVIQVVEACFAPDVTLLWPPELNAEVRAAVRRSAYLQEHISPDDLTTFLAALSTIAEPLPPLSEIEAFSRDPQDDYLIAYGLIHAADYLVSGDNDLLVLARVQGLRIVKPSEFLTVLDLR